MGIFNEEYILEMAETDDSNLPSKEEVYVRFDPLQQHKAANMIMPEFFFLKKKKKKKEDSGESAIKRFFAGKWPKLIAAFDVAYITLGYFADMLGSDDYLVAASMVVGGAVYFLERSGKLTLPPVCYFTMNANYVEYHYETGVKIEFIKLARLVGINPPKRVYFHEVDRVHFPFKAIELSLKKGKKVRMELVGLPDSTTFFLQKQVEQACTERSIPCTVSALSKSFQEKMENTENTA